VSDDFNDKKEFVAINNFKIQFPLPPFSRRRKDFYISDLSDKKINERIGDKINDDEVDEGVNIKEDVKKIVKKIVKEIVEAGSAIIHDFAYRYVLVPGS
jgi:hypothetical protein